MSRYTTDVAGFWERGYVVERGVFTPAEMAVVKRVVDDNAAMRAHAEHVRQKEQKDGTRPSFDSIFVWNDARGADVFAKVIRSPKLLDRLEAIFGDDVYVYHTKVALKYPGVVGFDYHQDYAYWYHMGNLWPDMATIFVAVDPATQENGCLRLIEGSHKLGRQDHELRDGVSDSGVDPERLAVIRAKLPEVPVELAPGDMVIFHCNTIHASADNRSAHSRVALLGCYNTRHNDPYKPGGGHPGWQRQARVDDPITEADLYNLPDFSI
jgi:ectoine hydroxylase-related dioxygenase (phytanoyl-CoA dioxygenase family)